MNKRRDEKLRDAGIEPRPLINQLREVSDTPRTDAAIDGAQWGMYADGTDGVTAEEAISSRVIAICYQLERALRAQTAILETCLQDSSCSAYIAQELESAILKARTLLAQVEAK